MPGWQLGGRGYCNRDHASQQELQVILGSSDVGFSMTAGAGGLGAAGPQVDLRLMVYVIAVAEEGSFQGAARRLSMTQPPLSRQVGQLEARLGCKLFERQPVRLTEAGRVFVEQARAIVAAVEDLAEAVRRVGRGEMGTVRVGYTLSAAYVEMPRIVDALAVEHPGIVVDGYELWDAELDKALEAGRVDVAIGRGLPHREGLEAETLRQEPFVVVVGAAHPMAARASVSLADLRGELFRFFPRPLAPNYHDIVLAALGSTGEAFEVWENPMPNLRHLAIRGSGGFTLLPRSVGEWLPHGVTAVPIDDPLPTIDLEFLWRPASAPPATASLRRTALRLAHSLGWA